MNRVTVLLFASMRATVGASSVVLDIPEHANVDEFKRCLAEQYPALGPFMPAALVSVNREYAIEDETIPAGAEVAVFPPVSGGAEIVTVVGITRDPLDLNDVVARITFSTTGAVCVFTGTVRAVTQRGSEHTTDYLEYEAYDAMADEKLRQVAEEMRSRWPDVEGILMIQRVGHLEPGVPTIAVACSAAHRDTGVFEAARYGIDRIKEIVPIWKKEVGPLGQAWVDGSHITEGGD